MTTKPWTTSKEHSCFGGHVRFVEHDSRETNTRMRFSIFVPNGPINGCLIWLSGLTCTEENFMAKAGAHKAAADHSLMIVCPDTSPRGLDIKGIRDHWDFGEGAGFYVDAVTPGYREHFRMYSYVINELYGLITQEFNVQGRIGIMGHSMGGHGALIMGLREPQLFCSVSAFAPIVNPMNCPWGQKAMAGYLGADNTEVWGRYDACELLRRGHNHPHTIMMDQGLKDPFLIDQLLTRNFADVAAANGQSLELRMHEGYDHSYYFIATFIASHIAFHASAIMEIKNRGK